MGYVTQIVYTYLVSTHTNKSKVKKLETNIIGLVWFKVLNSLFTCFTKYP